MKSESPEEKAFKLLVNTLAREDSKLVNYQRLYLQKYVKGVHDVSLFDLVEEQDVIVRELRSRVQLKLILDKMGA